MVEFYTLSAPPFVTKRSWAKHSTRNVTSVNLMVKEPSIAYSSAARQGIVWKWY